MPSPGEGSGSDLLGMRLRLVAGVLGWMCLPLVREVMPADRVDHPAKRTPSSGSLFFFLFFLLLASSFSSFEEGKKKGKKRKNG